MPGALGRPARAVAEVAFGEAEGKAVDRSQDALVIGRSGGVRRPPGAAHYRCGGEALEPRQGHVAVHVMAVRGVDVVAQPDAGVGDAELGISEQLGELGQGLAGRQGAVLQPQGPLRQGDFFQQRLGQPAIVIAGDEDDAPARHRLAQGREEGPGRLEHAGEGEVAQLEHVAEQDEAVGRGDLAEQHVADRRIARDVLAGTGAEVQVGDDRGAHRCPN